MSRPPASEAERSAAEPGSRFDFGQIAEAYDRWYDTRAGRVYDLLERRAVSKALPPAEPGARLLDVGCGTGHWSAFFSKQGYAVTGIDITREMIGVARGKGIGQTSFEVADAHALPFEDGCFDVTAAITTLEFVRDAEAVLREMVRCTASPGGIVLLGVLNSLAAMNIKRRKAHKPPYADARFFCPEDIERLLEPHGSVQVRVTTFAPRWKAALFLAPLIDFIGRLRHGRRGAFIVGRVVR